MGGGAYSSASRGATYTTAKATGASVFRHMADLKQAGKALVVHPLLDPRRTNEAGRVVRESRDSDEHPNSLPIAIMLDVTGSMSDTLRVFIDKLPILMNLLVDKIDIADPHILFGFIGDAYSDRVPLQVGNFESDNQKIDECFTAAVPEGGGGGQNTESYELGAYFLARHTELDSLDKRGKKGYVFFTGDELPKQYVSRGQVNYLIGDTLLADIPMEDIFAELKEKFNVFWIFPGQTSNYYDASINKRLKRLFGKGLIKLPNPNDICEMVAMTIAVCEGATTEEARAAYLSFGADAKGVAAAETALAQVIRERSFA